MKHRASVFGVSVSPEARGQGCGDALLRAALAHARTWEGVTSVHLSVTETQAAARRLYARHGFRAWGTQPDAVRDDAGRALSEHHLCLMLDETYRLRPPKPAPDPMKESGAEASNLVLGMGLEPTQLSYTPLKRARLPIPPPEQTMKRGQKQY